MKAETYIQRNWDKLPKSTFDGEEVVMVEWVAESDGGYGHHNFEGWGVNKEGKTVWCYSSGCSCNGEAGIDHDHTTSEKMFEAYHQFKEADWDKFDWSGLTVSYDSY
jgi:hypothetical protein